MGIVQTRSPRRARKSSGEAETMAQSEPVEGPSMQRAERGQRARQAIGHGRRLALDRRREVLHQVDLVDLAGGDGLPCLPDGLGVSGRLARSSPRAPPATSQRRPAAVAHARPRGSGRRPAAGRPAPAGRVDGCGAGSPRGHSRDRPRHGDQPRLPAAALKKPAPRRCASIASSAPAASWTSRSGLVAVSLTTGRDWAHRAAGGSAR